MFTNRPSPAEIKIRSKRNNIYISNECRTAAQEADNKAISALPAHSTVEDLLNHAVLMEEAANQFLMAAKHARRAADFAK